MGGGCGSSHSSTDPTSTHHPFAAQQGMPFFETSAKDGTGVHEAYASLLLQLAGEGVPPQERGAAAQPSAGCHLGKDRF